ncbi:MAG: hypothetical protein Q4C70_15325 [Planctomycetia bacterium]|nr:hypothetical protein [Planctomycetia bacterium]
MRPSENDEKISSMLGIGLDSDGETRLTHGRNFSLVGGTQKTHEIMQETFCKVNENLDRRGKDLQETTRHELRDVFQEVVESMNLSQGDWPER